MLRSIIIASVAALTAAVSAQTVTLFDGSSADAWVGPGGADPGWSVVDGFLIVKPGSGSIETREHLGSGRYHIEFLIPASPDDVTGQARGNSGVYLQNRYEIQILDSAGGPPEAGGCGAIYNITAPAVNAARPSEQWQTLDIDFIAPQIDADGRKTAAARVTVIHNGVTIHDHAEIPHPTGAARSRPEVAVGPLVLQDHGHPIRFRNIAFTPRPAEEAPPEPDQSVFKPVFDGQTLEGWEQRGGTAVYAVADESVVGETRPGAANTFLCTTGRYGDFELDLYFKIDDGLNSGVQIRSDARPDFKNGVVHGYQVEIDPSARAWTCGLYEENMRGWIDDLADNAPAQQAFRPGAWNHMRAVAIGHHVRTWLNGVPAADVVDQAGRLEGFIALQVHGVGNREEPLQVRWKGIRVRPVDAE